MSKRKGFTLIEIALFLGVTALIFLGVAMGVNNSLFQQQYNDSTSSFLEYMRSIYSKVSNPQGFGDGASESAIYGKLVVFGESVNLKGEPITPGTEVFSYDVIGKTAVGGTGELQDLLFNPKDGVGAGVVIAERDEKGNITEVEDLASPERYVPRWDAGIETTETGHQPVKRAILVVRHPRSGTINTLVYNNTIEINQKFLGSSAWLEGCKPGSAGSSCGEITRFFNDFSSMFSVEETDFCINPYGLGNGGNVPRQDIRILANARNAAAVELIDLDGSDNKCL